MTRGASSQQRVAFERRERESENKSSTAAAAMSLFARVALNTTKKTLHEIENAPYLPALSRLSFYPVLSLVGSSKTQRPRSCEDVTSRSLLCSVLKCKTRGGEEEETIGERRRRRHKRVKEQIEFPF